jgi:hypothetical protein
LNATHLVYQLPGHRLRIRLDSIAVTVQAEGVVKNAVVPAVMAANTFPRIIPNAVYNAIFECN